MTASNIVMKTCIICSCLEPGRHGIGDYSVKLALQLEKRGIITSLLALNDPYIKKLYINNDSHGDIELSILRLPAGWSVKKRSEIAKKWIEKNDPNWISFQSCLFSFNPNGLPLHLRPLLLNIGKERSWHIMFHELWLGESKSDSIKHRILGFFQKILISRIIQDLKPKMIFTSNRFYQLCLGKIGVQSQIVPLFSNIPLGLNEGQDLFEMLPNEILANRKNYIIGSFFGNVYFYPEIGGKILQLKNLVEKENRKLLITHLGRGLGVKKQFREWENLYGIKTYVFGEYHEQMIGDYFRQIDCGLSTYPKVLLEKSGSIAAMNFNKLPVILLRNSFVKDCRKLSWVKEVEEILNLSDFLKSAKTHESMFAIEHTVNKYENIFSAEGDKLLVL